jgi:hypothetical protein
MPRRERAETRARRRLVYDEAVNGLCAEPKANVAWRSLVPMELRVALARDESELAWPDKLLRRTVL